MENHASVTGYMVRVVFLIQMLLTFGGLCNRYFWDIRLKTLRLRNFNMLFQLVLTKFFKKRAIFLFTESWSRDHSHAKGLSFAPSQVLARKGNVTRDDSQRQFLAQHSVATLLFNGYNIVSTYCNAVLRQKSSLRIVAWDLRYLHFPCFFSVIPRLNYCR